MAKDFLSGILSFTFLDVLIFIPLLVFFISKTDKNYFFQGLVFVAGVFGAFIINSFIKIPYYMCAVLLLFALKEFGIFKSKPTLNSTTLLKKYISVFIYGTLFFVILNRQMNISSVLGLCIPLFLAVCAACSMGIRNSKNISGTVLIIYGTVFPLLKFFEVF